tara:strand:+ start:420 stop:695 length:276 start_codon:yes stop_codon:yes gene_type:complete
MSEKNENRKNENNKEIEKKIILIAIISIISIGIIIILYYLFTPEWGDNRARIWDILEYIINLYKYLENKFKNMFKKQSIISEEEYVRDKMD